MRYRRSIAIITCVALCNAVPLLFAEDAPPPAPAGSPSPAAVPAGADAPVMLSASELEQLAGPVALYPDVVLSSLLPATAFPMHVVMAARYVKEKGGKVEQVPEDKGWDVSVLGLMQFPDVLAWLDENPEWMEQVAYVLTYQQGPFMESIQECRRKTKANGALASNENIKVSEAPPPADAPADASSEQVIVIESTDPEVVYVPSYDYAAISSPTYVPTAYPALAWGTGFAMGMAGAWAGYQMGWWGNNGGDINVNNNFNRNTNVNSGNRGSGSWKPPGPAGGGQRAKPTGFSGGGASGWGKGGANSVRSPSKAKPGGTGGKAGGGGVKPPSTRPSAGGGRPSTMPARTGPAPSTMNGAGGRADSSRGNRSMSGGGAAKPAAGGGASRPAAGGGASRPSTGGGASRPSPSPSSGARSGGGSTYKPSSGASTRSASSRGSSSMGRSSGGGGGSRGGGGGGGGRGGGGGGRRS